MPPAAPSAVKEQQVQERTTVRKTTLWRDEMTMTEKLEVGFFGGVLMIGLPALLIGALVLFG
jgi:hypothetical protein